MAMAAPNLQPGSTSERIWRYIAGRPVNPDGSVYFRQRDAGEAAGAKTPNHANAAITAWEKQGLIEVIRHGRRVVGVRSKSFQPKGSQTDRIRDVLLAFADERGRVPIDSMHIQRLVGARDMHDTTKALWDLKERGFSTHREDKEGKVTRIRDIRIRPNAVAKAYDDVEPLPAIVADPETYRRPNGPASVLRSAIEVPPKDEVAEPEPEPEPDVVEPDEEVEPEPVEVREPEVKPGKPDAPEPEATRAPDRWEARFPLMYAAMGKVAKVKALQAASKNLEAAGPEFEEQAIVLLGKAEELMGPLEREVVAFIEEFVEENSRG